MRPTEPPSVVNPVWVAWDRVARFDNYQRPVDRHSDDGFPVDKPNIIGSDLRLAERVAGRMARPGPPGRRTIRLVAEPAERRAARLIHPAARLARRTTRVLVDRIGTRGLSKKKAGFDEWCKAVAPPTALRQWYGHASERFAKFSRRYRTELEEPERAAALEHLRDLARHGPLTLLTATKHADTGEAIVLASLLRDRLGACLPDRHRRG